MKHSKTALLCILVSSVNALYFGDRPFEKIDGNSMKTYSNLADFALTAPKQLHESTEYRECFNELPEYAHATDTKSWLYFFLKVALHVTKLYNMGLYQDISSGRICLYGTHFMDRVSFPSAPLIAHDQGVVTVPQVNESDTTHRILHPFDDFIRFFRRDLPFNMIPFRFLKRRLSLATLLQTSPFDYLPTFSEETQKRLNVPKHPIFMVLEFYEALLAHKVDGDQVVFDSLHAAIEHEIRLANRSLPRAIDLPLFTAPMYISEFHDSPIPFSFGQVLKDFFTPIEKFSPFLLSSSNSSPALRKSTLFSNLNVITETDEEDEEPLIRGGRLRGNSSPSAHRSSFQKTKDTLSSSGELEATNLIASNPSKRVAMKTTMDVTDVADYYLQHPFFKDFTTQDMESNKVTFNINGYIKSVCDTYSAPIPIWEVVCNKQTETTIRSDIFFSDPSYNKTDIPSDLISWFATFLDGKEHPLDTFSNSPTLLKAQLHTLIERSFYPQWHKHFSITNLAHFDINNDYDQYKSVYFQKEALFTEAASAKRATVTAGGVRTMRYMGWNITRRLSLAGMNRGLVVGDNFRATLAGLNKTFVMSNALKQIDGQDFGVVQFFDKYVDMDPTNVSFFPSANWQDKMFDIRMKDVKKEYEEKVERRREEKARKNAIRKEQGLPEEESSDCVSSEKKPPVIRMARIVKKGNQVALGNKEEVKEKELKKEEEVKEKILTKEEKEEKERLAKEEIEKQKILAKKVRLTKYLERKAKYDLPYKKYDKLDKAEYVAALFLSSRMLTAFLHYFSYIPVPSPHNLTLPIMTNIEKSSKHFEAALKQSPSYEPLKGIAEAYNSLLVSSDSSERVKPKSFNSLCYANQFSDKKCDSSLPISQKLPPSPIKSKKIFGELSISPIKYKNSLSELSSPSFQSEDIFGASKIYEDAVAFYNQEVKNVSGKKATDVNSVSITHYLTDALIRMPKFRDIKQFMLFNFFLTAVTINLETKMEAETIMENICTNKGFKLLGPYAKLLNEKKIVSDTLLFVRPDCSVANRIYPTHKAFMNGSVIFGRNLLHFLNQPAIASINKYIWKDVVLSWANTMYRLISRSESEFKVPSVHFFLAPNGQEYLNQLLNDAAVLSTSVNTSTHMDLF